MRPLARPRCRPLVLILVAWALGLIDGPAISTSPAPMEEPMPELPADRLVLRDVHPLFGGRNLYLDKQGRGVLQVVERSPDGSTLRDRRYDARLSPESLGAIARSLAAHDCLRGEPPAERVGRPGESRVTLRLDMHDEKVLTVMKWSGQDHVSFDGVYQSLLERIPEIRRASAPDEVPYDPRWVPNGFTLP